MKRCLPLLCALVLGSAPAAWATPIVYTATLSGAAEFPPNDSMGTGSTTLTYDDMLHTLRVQVTFSDLTGTTTASHVHCCTAVPGTGTVGVATELPTFTGFPLGVSSGTYDHTFDLTLASTWNPSFLAASGGTPMSAESMFIGGLNAGAAYLNIHTTYKPAGEIRGFPAAATVPEPSTLALLGLGAAGVIRRRRQVRP